MTGVEHYREEFARLRHELPGGTALAPVREAALARFLDAGFPTLREETWKYTNVRPIARKAFRASATAGAPPAQGVLADFGAGALGDIRLVFVDGHHVASLGALDGLPADTRIESLATAIGRDAAALRARFETDDDAPAFAAMNAALGGDGVFVSVPADTRLAATLHLLFLTTAATADLAQYPRVVIELGDGAEADVIEHYAGVAEATSFTNTVTLARLGRGAKLQHVKLQQEAPNTYHIGWMGVEQERDSELVQHSISLGARLARHDLRVRLAGAGASATLRGLYVARGRQHVDHHTRVDHLVAHTVSEEIYRGVLNDHARGVFNGKVVVHEQAVKSVAHQSNRNLLLAPTAEIDTKPELEIYVDDVQCSHGATVGQIDATALFYLRSRGIELDTARSLLVYAFADDVLAGLTHAGLRARVETEVLGRLPDADRLKQFV